jgi:hypothetical protein
MQVTKPRGAVCYGKPKGPSVMVFHKNALLGP